MNVPNMTKIVIFGEYLMLGLIFLIIDYFSYHFKKISLRLIKISIYIDTSLFQLNGIFNSIFQLTLFLLTMSVIIVAIIQLI